MTVLVGARDEARGREAERVLRAEGADARFLQLDVTDGTSIGHADRWIESEYGRLDVLVNNAGVPTTVGSRTLPSETSLDDMRAVYEINVFGVIAVTNAMLPLLRRAEAARIVNVQRGRLDLVADRSGQPVRSAGVLGAVPLVQDGAEHDHGHVRQGAPGHPDQGQRRQPWLHRDGLHQPSRFRSAAEGAEPSVHLATLPADGPSGVLWGHMWTTDGDDGYGTLAW